jgi:DNA-binding CsgD family transcriptional regulator
MTLLTSRKRDVVRLVAEGMRNQEIALSLNLSENTVRNYLLRIFDKLAISSRVELVLYAVTGLSRPEHLRKRRHAQWGCPPTTAFEDTRRDVIWLETVPELNTAVDRMKQLAVEKPSPYFVFCAHRSSQYGYVQT